VGPVSEAAATHDYPTTLYDECIVGVGDYSTWLESTFSAVDDSNDSEGMHRILVETQSWWFEFNRDDGTGADYARLATGKSMGTCT
jgi:hypothetical protein